MLFIVIISILSMLTQNGVNAWSFPNPIDYLTDKVSDTFNDALGELDDIIDKIPNIPAIIKNAIEFGQCMTNAANLIINPGSSTANDAKLIIEQKLTRIKECKSSIIHSVKSIISDNNKDAYLDLAKGFFDKCSGLNAGAITIELGASGNTIVGGSVAAGLAIDTTNGEVYGYTAGCGGIATDIQADGGITLSLFDKLDDVKGCSKYYAMGFDVNILGVEAGMDAVIVYSAPANDIIARGIGFGVGVGLNPSGTDTGYCYTFEPKKLLDLNDFKKNDIIDKIPALSTYIPETQTIQVGKLVQFACGHWITTKGFNIDSKYIYHDNFELYCWIDYAKGRPNWNNTIFTVHKALNGKEGQFSFESINFPGYYIRHTGRRFRIDYIEHNDIYKQDASFIPYNSLNDVEGEQSFETSTNGYRYNFMRTANDGTVWLDVWEDTSDYRQDISFVVFQYRPRE